MYSIFKIYNFIFILQKVYLLIERERRREETDKANERKKILLEPANDVMNTSINFLKFLL